MFRVYMDIGILVLIIGGSILAGALAGRRWWK